jgi:formate dehydrogenase
MAPLDTKPSGAPKGVWKSGKGKGRHTPKGRQFTDEAQAEITRLLGDRPRRCDLLIEFLHLIQDAHGHISADHIAALAVEMRIGQAEIYETATFYAHFDVVKEGETPPPALTIRVCDSLSCEMAGAQQLQKALEEGLDPSEVRVVRAPCMGRCDTAPVLEIGHNHIDHATPEKVHVAIAADDTHAHLPDYETFAAYEAEGGYAKLKELRDSGDWEKVQEDVLSSGLRGLGGAGFPSGKNWGFVRMNEGPRYLAVNGDEGEPGTFKDRYYLERTPHVFLEGMLIAAWAVEAETCFIYMRDEYPAVLEILATEIEALRASGVITSIDIELRRGAGAYICGEESAMIESIEGKRGLPRHRPPFIAQVGLFGRPTLNHNVETLFWIRDIVEKGPEWFASQGRRDHKGFRSFSVSGRVKEPGVKLAPAGITMNELLEEFCGGMEEGHTFKGYLPGGASGGILPATLADEPLDFGTLDKHGCFIGSHAIVVFSDQDDMRDVALNLIRLFKHESCGQCTPCRSGTEKMEHLLAAGDWNETKIADLDAVMRSASICGLGQAASNPVASVLKFFPEEFER